MRRVIGMAAVVGLLSAAAPALAGPEATVTVGETTVPAPIYAECAKTSRPDGTASAYCADGIPSTEHPIAAIPGSVARIRFAAPMHIGGAILRDAAAFASPDVLSAQPVDATTFDVKVPLLWGPKLLMFGGKWSDGTSSGDAHYAALLVPAAPELVRVERGRRVVVAMHAGGRVIAELRRGGRLLGRGVRTLTSNGEARLTIALTRAGRGSARRRAKLTVVARQVGVEPVTFTRRVRVG